MRSDWFEGSPAVTSPLTAAPGLRGNDRYYASFVEDDNGIRIEFMHNPPREALAD